MNLFTPIIVDTINELVYLLNEELPSKQQYRYVGWCFIEDIDLTVIQVVNLNNEYLYNALDYKGETPDNFSACWRSLELLAKDFEELLNIQIKK